MASSILNSDDGVISGTSGLKSTGGDDGVLVFQSKGTETARINTDSQIVAAAGTASLPIYSTTGDTNTGIFFPAADQVAVATNGVERVNLGNSATVFNDGGADVDFRVEGDTEANLLFVDAGNDRVGVGTSSPSYLLEAKSSTAGIGITGTGTTANVLAVGNTNVSNTFYFAQDNAAGNNFNTGVAYGPVLWTNASSQTFVTDSGSNIMKYSSGNLLVGATSGTARLRVISTASQTQGIYVTHPTSAQDVISCENSATSGDNRLIHFYTDATNSRGLVEYNRSTGLLVYGTTSDYRAKDIFGPVTDSGTLIDSVPVYMGKMKDATQERPMFIAHETPSYAHTGVKDAVDADGKPVYQQMDASALVPVMWAEIQSLRKRLAAANL
jgi:hypothetical protein